MANRQPVAPQEKSKNLDVPNDGPGRSAPGRTKETSFTLRPPFVAEHNNYFEVGGATSVEDKFVRLTPALPSKTGFLYSKSTSQLTDWEVVLEFSIHAGIRHGGGEGMAFWYTSRKLIGPVFGGHDFWDGLGILIDTHDNDKRGASPLITAIYNDGTRKYSAWDDGASQAMGSCALDLRNSPTTSFLRITYLNKVLTVQVAKDLNVNGDPVFQPCLVVPVDLGVDKYFGVTAATGMDTLGPVFRVFAALPSANLRLARLQTLSNQSLTVF